MPTASSAQHASPRKASNEQASVSWTTVHDIKHLISTKIP
jgi:hypothetical protein